MTVTDVLRKLADDFVGHGRDLTIPVIGERLHIELDALDTATPEAPTEAEAPAEPVEGSESGTEPLPAD